MPSFEQPPIENIQIPGPENEGYVQKWEKKLEELGFEQPEAYAKRKSKTFGGVLFNVLSSDEDAGFLGMVHLKEGAQYKTVRSLASSLTDRKDFDGLAEALKKYARGHDLSPMIVYEEAIVHASADISWLRRIFMKLAPEEKDGGSKLLEERLKLHPEDPDSLELAGDYDYSSVKNLAFSSRVDEILDRAEREWAKALHILQERSNKAGYRDMVPAERLQELYKKLDELKETRERMEREHAQKET